ncbi:murein L,D-transpeptidase catalytic domain family protein [Halobacteriovorax sp. GB3]|uniref:murein L,D-transpeptidase catalytic domain-containing protein n=1 Tax=Halobacteriovorax sp. GB3 TaxID=2719615 RepID=UPI00235DEFEA|nr:murein L,D-transpeptidase catalytic domain family protein [Halobacteriovorax sp. GB3]MDD0854390.1 murein L,D-transpeptidase catalytic domain family protein [Halobacteriovorax sp. GB3]
MKTFIFTLAALFSLQTLSFDQTIYDNFEKVGGNQIALDQLKCFWENNLESSFREGITIKRKRFVTIHDLTKKGNEYRFFIIDLESKEVVAYPSAHGSGKGRLKNKRSLAKHFSNKMGSDLTPSGFFVTGPVYKNWKKWWKFGIRLFGLQKGENEKSYDRGIVIHAAKNSSGSYVDNSMISSLHKTIHNFKSAMTSGMSDGCSAVPPKYWSSIRDMIKDGSLFFVFTEDYLEQGSSYCLKL